jgi:GNAT superfamily N-acetyltransferase
MKSFQGSWVNPLEQPDESEAAASIAECIYRDNDEEPFRTLRRYHEEEGLALIGLSEGGRLAGLAGIKAPSYGDAVMLHLAVQPDLRGGGIGGMLVRRCLELSRSGVLRAETDSDAVGFYRKLGFSIRSLGEKYPGVERFECTLRRYAAREARDGDFDLIAAWPASREEAFYMYPPASYPMSPAQLKAAAEERICPTLLLEASDGAPAAYANLYESEDRLWIGNVIVNPAYRGKGAAAALLAAMEAAAADRVRELHLTCHSINTKALLFYSGAGWEPWAIRKMSGPDGAPIAGIRMRKKLMD